MDFQYKIQLDIFNSFWVLQHPSFFNGRHLLQCLLIPLERLEIIINQPFRLKKVTLFCDKDFSVLWWWIYFSLSYIANRLFLLVKKTKAADLMIPINQRFTSVSSQYHRHAIEWIFTFTASLHFSIIITAKLLLLLVKLKCIGQPQKPAALKVAASLTKVKKCTRNQH